MLKEEEAEEKPSKFARKEQSQWKGATLFENFPVNGSTRHAFVAFMIRLVRERASIDPQFKYPQIAQVAFVIASFLPLCPDQACHHVKTMQNALFKKIDQAALDVHVKAFRFTDASTSISWTYMYDSRLHFSPYVVRATWWVWQGYLPEEWNGGLDVPEGRGKVNSLWGSRFYQRNVRNFPLLMTGDYLVDTVTADDGVHGTISADESPLSTAEIVQRMYNIVEELFSPDLEADLRFNRRERFASHFGSMSSREPWDLWCLITRFVNALENQRKASLQARQVEVIRVMREESLLVTQIFNIDTREASLKRTLKRLRLERKSLRQKLRWSRRTIEKRLLKVLHNKSVRR